MVSASRLEQNPPGLQHRLHSLPGLPLFTLMMAISSFQRQKFCLLLTLAAEQHGLSFLSTRLFCPID